MYRDTEKRQLILIEYLQNLVNENTKDKWKIKAECSTNDNDKRVIAVQEQVGQKEVFYGDIEPLYNYYMIEIFGLTIKECKDLSLLLVSLIGKNIIIDKGTEKWQLMIIQNMNPQFIEYEDLRRVGYTMSWQCVIGKIWEKE